MLEKTTIFMVVFFYAQILGKCHFASTGTGTGTGTDTDTDTDTGTGTGRCENEKQFQKSWATLPTGQATNLH